MPRRSVTILRAGLLALSLGLAGPPAALAHAVVVETSLTERPLPPDKPTTVLLKFNATLERSFIRTSLLEPGGVERALPARPATSRAQILVELPGLSPGRYVLRYTVLATDGHLTEDIIRFRVAAEE